MSVLKIKCFGKPQVWLDEAPLEQLVSAKAKATKAIKNASPVIIRTDNFMNIIISSFANVGLDDS